ncbi:hypothetical protein A2477_02570 [Candidatus Falkowbacteria bacterium RIFOXYC2_FULL_47_12]|uniref:Uncharacterized protein n=2 Tax=Candidatus Falkowiibacteriota TaxID=1752728 RepID=A0A1F5TQ48_9BACT|nr:MAG: hypothetical protein A2242_02690 [Candidatus Falkowbacteria bacterium RIFOXYA2_FULL_47_9]OGF40967.1 MAG: hypothetical protein A2477_02570 [Candidatus Falkowbacteria bacterium RIFOXYC2_FULL_47_12]
MSIEQNNQENIPMSFEEYEVYVAKLKERLNNIEPDIMKRNDLQTDKAAELKKQYKKVDQYATWHVLAGSSLSPDMPPQFKDFPEQEDSVEGWLDDLEQKLKSEDAKE